MISVPFFHERSITMSTNNKNLHLTDQDRIIIEKGIENSSTKAAIALTLVKDKSTIGKEIKAHRCSYNPSCANKDECSHNHVCSDCPDFKPFKYNRRDRSLVPATAVSNILIVVMTSLNILPILHTRNTEKNSL